MIGAYLGIHEKIVDAKDELKYEFYQLEHKIRHILQDEQEHITELKLLFGIK